MRGRRSVRNMKHQDEGEVKVKGSIRERVLGGGRCSGAPGKIQSRSCVCVCVSCEG